MKMSFVFEHDRRFEARRIVAVRPDHVPAELLEGVVELVDRAAIELPRGDELVAGLQQHMECPSNCAACPEAAASAAVPPSSAATRASSTACVGFMMRV